MLRIRLVWVVGLSLLVIACSAAKGKVEKTNGQPPKPDAAWVEPDAAQVEPLSPSPAGAPNTLAGNPGPGPAADQVLNRASFQGGTVGSDRFSGGEVLLWESEPGRLTVQAILHSQPGVSKPAANTSGLSVGKDRSFYVSAALLNDVAQSEQRVPLWALFGKVTRPEIKVITITFPGIPTFSKEVDPNGTWLYVHQGLLSLGPPSTGTAVALDGQWHEVARQTIRLGQPGS